MYYQTESHKDFCEDLNKKLNCNGYVCISGFVRQQDSSKQLQVSIAQESKMFTLLDKKATNVNAYEKDGFCIFIFNLFHSYFPNSTCKPFELKLSDDNNSDLFCVLYYESKIDLIQITSIPEFLESTNTMTSAMKKIGISQYYRGQVANWNINPSLYRYHAWVENEAVMNAKIISDRPSDFADCRTEFERLVRLKHYTQPSRLLDLTSNPLIGLYFACEYMKARKGFFGLVHCCYSDKNEEKFAVLSDGVLMLTAITRSVFRCKKLIQSSLPCSRYSNFSSSNDMEEECDSVECEYINEIAYQWKKETSFDFIEMNTSKLDTCLVVHPPLNNHRIIQQQGLFIMCGRNQKKPYEAPDSLDDFFNFKGKRRAYLIHPKDVKGLMDELSYLGINEYYIYGDLEKGISVEKDRVNNEQKSYE